MPRNVTMCVQFCCWSDARINLLVVGNFILSYKVKVYMALKVMHLFALMRMWCVWNCIVSEYFFHLLIDALYMLIKIWLNSIFYTASRFYVFSVLDFSSHLVEPPLRSHVVKTIFSWVSPSMSQSCYWAGELFVTNYR